MHAFCGLLMIFSKSTFLKKTFRNTIRVSKGFDPDQARHFVCKGYQQTKKVAGSKQNGNIEGTVKTNSFT